jgi:hypothetical protein
MKDEETSFDHHLGAFPTRISEPLKAHRSISFFGFNQLSEDL